MQRENPDRVRLAENDPQTSRLTGLGRVRRGLVTPRLSTIPAVWKCEVAAVAAAIRFRELEEIPDRVGTNAFPVGLNSFLRFGREIVVPDPAPEPPADSTQHR